MRSKVRVLDATVLASLGSRFSNTVYELPRGRAWAGRVVLGRGRVGHVGRVGTIMRAAGARVCAVVGAEASSRSDLAKPFFGIVVCGRV